MTFVSEQDAAKELVTRFQGHAVNGMTIDQSPYFSTYCKISSTLTNMPLVEGAVRKLDAAIVKLVADRKQKKPFFSPQEKAKKETLAYLAKREHGMKQFHADLFAKNDKPQYPDKDKLFSHLMTEALWAEESKAGFANPNYLVDGVGAKEFLDNVRDLHPFKDYGANAGHGDLTHRIHWWVLMKTCVPVGAASVYASIADWCFNVGKGPELTLWDALFDRAFNTSFGPNGPTDFRGPVVFHTWLRQNTVAPVLAALLSLRYIKRTTNQDKRGFLAQSTPHNIVAMKLYHQYYERLSGEELGYVNEYASGATVRNFPASKY